MEQVIGSDFIAFDGTKYPANKFDCFKTNLGYTQVFDKETGKTVYTQSDNQNSDYTIKYEYDENGAGYTKTFDWYGEGYDKKDISHSTTISQYDENNFKYKESYDANADGVVDDIANYERIDKNVIKFWIDYNANDTMDGFENVAYCDNDFNSLSKEQVDEIINKKEDSEVENKNLFHKIIDFLKSLFK